MIIAGVNGGGTKTEAVCCDENGKIVGNGSSGPSNYHNIGLESMIDSISQALSMTGFPKPDVLCVALAGIDSVKDHDNVEKVLQERYPGAILEYDAYAEMYIETRGNPGIMAIAGTGSVVLGYDGRKRYKRCNTGFFLGDEGSGYFIGREALRLSAKMIFEGYDETQIANEVVSYLGLKEKEDIIAWAYSKSNTVTTVAGIARAVEKAAISGDTNAINILNTASSNLATAALGVARMLKINKVYIKDGVFMNRIYLSNFTAILASNSIEVKHIEGSAAIGAMLIAADKAGLAIPFKP
ncbi:MAG: BadF/BadG/BcrA/BcrD ATPase family protein [Candidatus Micrarchaeaceae archaeon]